MHTQDIGDPQTNGEASPIANQPVNGDTDGIVINGNGQGPTKTHEERLKDSINRGIDLQVMRYPETGINVLIAGAGLGGISCALECWRKGHTVRVLDRSPTPVWTGDNVQIQPSAILLLRHWPDMGYEVEENQYDVAMSYYKMTGERIWGPAPPMFNDPENLKGRRGFPSVNAHSRIKLYRAFLRQAERIGIQVEWGCKVVEYWEDLGQGAGGVTLESGEKRTADIVVAADGLRTKSNTIVPMPETLATSGKAIYRAGYPIEYALKDPLVKEMWNFDPEGQPVWQFWLGNGSHNMIAMTHDIAFWSFIHSHDESASESWVPDVDPSEVIAAMEKINAVHPAVAAFIKTAPKGSVVNWQLKFRDPHEQWTSPGGRVVQLGDAAHAFLPTSGNGATQAIEDGVTLATCLQLAGKSQAAYATKVYNKLRFQRVSCGQKMGFVNQQLKQHTDWDAIAKNPALIRSRYPKWVWSHDPEAYAYEKFCEALHHVLSGGKIPLHNTNFPKGHKYRHWTMKEVQEQIKAGQKLEDLQDGDWS
ncbi:fusarubin cluster-monooxygenase [Fusarium longipes]|uniref:Fusarubin cluster-monooxygenase n=1 Tax=Fusarium longipes TaxID=694270 RepID=A0A395T726_9HYPO|nr:fusarubin cluster-monooxygenase [Fusarium longipes]